MTAESHCVPEVVSIIMEAQVHLSNRSEDGVVGPQCHVQPVISRVRPAAALNVQGMHYGHVPHLDTAAAQVATDT